jgi:hypothetical protein
MQITWHLKVEAFGAKTKRKKKIQQRRKKIQQEEEEKCKFKKGGFAL